MIESDVLGKHLICNEHRYGIAIWGTRFPVVATYSTPIRLMNAYIEVHQNASEKGVEIVPFKRYKGRKQVWNILQRKMGEGELVRLVEQIRDRRIVMVEERVNLALAG